MDKRTDGDPLAAAVALAELQQELDDVKADVESLAEQLDEANEYRDRQNRIEALRAASRIGAGHAQSGKRFWIDGKNVSMAKWAVNAAKTFVKFIEEGE